MKKILIFIIIIAMTLSLGAPAFAATPATVTVASPTAAVNPGSTVDVAVTIADNPGMDVMKLKFSYDTTALTLKDIELGSVMTGTFTKNLDKAVALLEAAGTTNATGNGTLVTLKFEVKSTAAAGNYTIDFLVADAVNRDEARVALTTQAGTVSVEIPVATYTVRFNANGGTGAMADVTGVPAGTYTLPANGFTAPAGKQFKGWATDAAGAVITDTTYNVTGDVTLYAIWEDVPHSHSYNTEWSTDEANHWHECTCGDKKDVAAHVDANNDHNCDVCGRKTSDHKGGTATCTEKATCSICGQKYGDLAPHNYKTEWSTDETNHWHECSVCGDKKDVAVHTPGAEATETTSQTCTVCGYVIKAALGHTHNFNQKNTSETYLKSAATCTKKAVYYYSCSCGEKGTETFESGETLAHTWGTKWVNNDGKHWHECAVCNTKSDEADHAFEWKIDKEATVTEAGAKHEECKVCGYKKAAIAIDKLAPSIIDGGNAKWNKGGENNLTFKSDAAFSDFVEVLVDGKVITAENYEKREGSIIIQLKASYLATLAKGEHTLTIRSTSGDATTKFTVEAEIVSPPTGSTNVWVWIIICVISLGVGATSVVFTIRKRKTA
ncbi:MAG: cohesin domain-containing protein [Eubacteriales bacterium]|nr:cohesin domain-containing protein [Eubacteriales bacterium]